MSRKRWRIEPFRRIAHLQNAHLTAVLRHRCCPAGAVSDATRRSQLITTTADSYLLTTQVSPHGLKPPRSHAAAAPQAPSCTPGGATAQVDCRHTSNGSATAQINCRDTANSRCSDCQPPQNGGARINNIDRPPGPIGTNADPTNQYSGRARQE